LRNRRKLDTGAAALRQADIAWQEESRYDRFEFLLVADEMLSSLGPAHLLTEGSI
jgi:hypothetical protein